MHLAVQGRKLRKHDAHFEPGRNPEAVGQGAQPTFIPTLADQEYLYVEALRSQFGTRLEYPILSLARNESAHTTDDNRWAGGRLSGRKGRCDPCPDDFDRPLRQPLHLATGELGYGEQHIGSLEGIPNQLPGNRERRRNRDLGAVADDAVRDSRIAPKARA